MLINRQKNLEFLCEQLRAAAVPVALDTEFISEKRYSPRLCLVQVYAQTDSETIEALLDPFALDLRPLLDLFADPSITKIVHAGGQDLQIVYQEFGCKTQHVFDTQIAAAFLGYGHQAGYADLVRRALGGPALSKELQFTDWSARPLTPAQMEYALDDVRYLPQLYNTLRRDLVARGRLDWAKAELRRAELKAQEDVDPAQVYRKLNTAGLTRRQLGTLRELAATREVLARKLNKPTTFIVPDLVLVQLAKQPPANPAELRSRRGMPGLSSEQSDALCNAVDRAAQLAPDELPERFLHERPDPQTDAVLGVLGVVAQLRANDEDIARAYLAPRDQLMALTTWWLSGERAAGAELPDLPLLNDWRGELLGTVLLQLLRGELAVTLDEKALRNNPPRSAIKILPVPAPKA